MRCTYLVHRLAYVCPWCPEVEDRDPGEVLGQQLLKVLRRRDGDMADGDEVGEISYNPTGYAV